MLRVFVGFDKRQPIAFHVAMQSIIEYANNPTAVIPLKIEALPIVRRGLTPFTYSRFLVPWLCDFEGTALYIDSDFMARADIEGLFLKNKGHAVHVVPRETNLKFEMASMMLFNCSKCQILTPGYVSSADGLHQLKWTDDIGHIGKEWNHLVGYDDPNPQARLVHYTQGLPCFPKTQNDEFADEWRSFAKSCISTQSWESLMGHSVHAPHVINRGQAHAS
jgi:hypothetical protein